MMAGDREMRATRGLNDTQLMLARDAGDERGGSAITPPGPDGAGRVAGPIIKSTNIKGEEFVVRSAKMATSAWGRYCRKSIRDRTVELNFEIIESGQPVI
jgi:hypothetical protein